MRCKFFIWMFVLLIALEPGLARSAQQPAPGEAPFPKVPPQIPTPPTGPRIPAVPVQPGAPVPVQPAVPPTVVQPSVPTVPPQTVPSPVAQPRPFQPSPPTGGMVSLNFTRADLVEIIHIIAQHLRLTYTIDPDVKGTVTINSAEPLRSEDLMPIFHQILRMNDAVAVRTGNLYQITTINKGKGLARPAGQGQDSFALQVVPVRFFTVAEMKKVLQPFVTPGGEIIENPRGNFLIIVDIPSNIQRLVEIADLIDVQIFAGTRMEIYQPKVASAEELSQEMTKVMQSFASSAPQTDTFTAEFIPLPRINQLLVISHSEAAWTYARRWLERIDVVAEGPGRRIFIYPVENGKAADLADVLSQALGLPVTATRGQSPSLQDLHRATPGGQQSGTGSSSSPYGQSSGFGSQQRPMGSAFATIPAPSQPGAPVVPTPVQPPVSPGVAPGTAARPPTPGAAAQPGAKPEEQLRIVADLSTNSLIIYGTAQEFQNIKNILKDLDIIPRQVLIDALILQVDLRDLENLGVDYEIIRQRTTIFGQTYRSLGALRSLGGLFASPNDQSAITNLGATGIFGDNNVQAMIRALASDSRVKVISSPTVLATDNRPARIQVGTEEPIPTGTISTPGVNATNFSTSTTIQYRNTGRILTIIPQVNSQGLVHLQVKAEVSSRGDDVTVGNQSFPAFNTQDAETTAIVQDGETLVIGGLIGERKSRLRTGLPYLMDLPVVGRFFGTTTDDSNRTELIMLITPRVIRSREESRIVSEDFKNKLGAVRNELERMRADREREQERQRRLRQPLPPPATQIPQGEIPIQPAPQTEQPAQPQPPPAPAKGAPLTMDMQSVPAQPFAGPAKAMNPPMSPLAQSGMPTQIPAPVAPQPPIDAGSPAMSNPAIAMVPSHEPFTATTTGADPINQLLNTIESNTSQAVQVESTGGQTVQTTQPAPASAKTSVWVVQIASYDRQADAQSYASRLQSKGFDANVSAAEAGGKMRYRVEIGPLATRNEALVVQKNLRAAQNIENTLVLSRLSVENR